MKHVLIIISTILAAMLFLGKTTPTFAQTTFRFGVWADTKSGTGVLNTDSISIAAKNPLFLFYPGDVCSSGPDTACFATWKTAYNAGGDLFSKTFASRGNHDASGTALWTANFNVASVVSKIAATNLSQLSTNLSYSFDYGNSHFVAIDMPGGDATTMSSGQLTWLDSDLTSAEDRGIKHSFVFFHGPEYPMGGHCCTNATSLAQTLGRHVSVSASFHGHEHNLAYSHIDSTKIAGITHQYEEFTSGGAGADLYGCQRGDWCKSMSGFMTVDVNGTSFTVTVYNSSGVSQNSWTFNKSSGSPTPTPVSTNTPTPTPTSTHTPTPTPTPVSTNTPTPTPTSTHTPTPTPTTPPLNGDANGDGKVDGIDYVIWLTHYSQSISGGRSVGDFNLNGKIDGIDYVIWLNAYTG